MGENENNLAHILQPKKILSSDQEIKNCSNRTYEEAQKKYFPCVYSNLIIRVHVMHVTRDAYYARDACYT